VRLTGDESSRVSLRRRKWPRAAPSFHFGHSRAGGNPLHRGLPVALNRTRRRSMSTVRAWVDTRLRGYDEGAVISHCRLLPFMSRPDRRAVSRTGPQPRGRPTTAGSRRGASAQLATSRRCSSVGAGSQIQAPSLYPGGGRERAGGVSGGNPRNPSAARFALFNQKPRLDARQHGQTKISRERAECPHPSPLPEGEGVSPSHSAASNK